MEMIKMKEGNNKMIIQAMLSYQQCKKNELFVLSSFF